VRKRVQASSGQANSGQERRLRGWIAAALAIGFYFILQLPFASTLVVMHPDERHYAHSASRMIESGDWLIPRTPQDELRLRKPIIPYWISAAGFKTFGMGVLGSRLFWVFCSLGILALTYALARTLGAGERTSLLAMFLTGGNPLFMRASVNAIPDMPLTLFMLVSALGFARLLKDDDPPAYAGWLAWLGAGLAVLTKGILPFVFLAVVFISAFLFARGRLKNLLRPLPILIAIALVASWYLYAILKYPDAFYAEFIGDQLTKKVARSPFEIPLAILIYTGIGIASFFFLPLVLGVLGRGKKLGALPPEIKMLGLWVLIVPIAFSLGGFISERYLLPAVPVLAALLALGFSRLDPEGRGLTQASRVLLALVLIIQLAAIALYLAIEFQLAARWEAVLFALFSAGVISVIVHAVWTGKRAAFVLTASIVVVAAMSYFPLRHLVMPHPGDILAERLEAAQIDPSHAFLWGDSELAAAVRLHAPRAEMFREVKEIGRVTMDGRCVVMSDKKRYIDELQARGFTVETIKGGWRLIDPQRLIEAAWNGRLKETRDERAATAVWATCPAP
jgi:4-amino-4-deoxy-L-arabinose transferase-like glycosyltransferase